MTLTVQRSLAIVAAIAVGGLAVVQAGEQASDSGAGTPGEWECWDPDSPNPCRHDLNAVSIVSETDAWAVGDSGYVQRWDGRQWEAVPGPCAGDLAAVDMLARNDGWAVCDGSIYRWDGRGWSLSLPRPDDLFGLLTLDMYASDHGWAGGHVGAGGLYQWDGSQWLEATATGTAGSFEEIDVLSASEAWAIVRNPEDVLATRWDGVRWTGVPFEVPGTTQLDGISMVSSTDGWIVGESHDERRNLAYRWDGARWSRAGFGPFGDEDGWYKYSGLSGVDASDAGDVWVAGGRGTIGRFDGSAWSVVDGGTALSFEDVQVVAPDDGWAVGRGGVASHWDGLKWSASGSIKHVGYKGIHMAAAADGWAVGFWMTRSEGMRAAIFRWDGVDWRLFTEFGNGSLAAVDFAGPDVGWAVGNLGTILQWDGVSWAPVESGTTNSLFDVVAVGRDDAWAVGSRGTILHWDGADWASVDAPIQGATAVEAVDFVDANDGWAIAGADMLHWDGTAWSAGPFPAVPFGDVLFIDHDNGWALGSSIPPHNAILHWDGDEWTVSAEIERVTESPTVLAANGNGEVWAAGREGAIYRWDGTTWSREESGTTGQIYDMAFSPDGDGWAGGYSQLLMRYVPQATTTPEGPDPGPTPGGVGPNTIYAPDVQR